MLCAGNWLSTETVDTGLVDTGLVEPGPFDEALDLDDSVIEEPLLSLFIPRVFPSVTEKNMKDIFHSQQLGDVARVDFVEKIDKFGKKYKNAYIHFNQWYSNKTAEEFRARVCAHPGAQARIVYDDPWYWTVLENTYDITTPTTTTPKTTTTTIPTISHLVPTQVLKRALGLPTTVATDSSIIIHDNESNWQCERIHKDVLHFSNPTPRKPAPTNATPITNLVSEDYVKHIEEMNADLLDRIQALETKLRIYENRDSNRMAKSEQ